MIIFCFIILFFIPFLNYLFFNNKKINTVVILSIPLLFFNLISFVFFGLYQLKYQNMMIISYCVLFTLLFAFFIYIIFNLSRGKIKITWITFKNAINKTMILWIGFIIFIIISLFINTSFPDTQAYLSASIDYLNGTTINFNDSFEPVPLFYQAMPQIIIYPSLFANNTPFAYYLLSPFLLFVIYTTIINEWSYTKQYHYSKILNSFFVIALAIACPFLANFMTSGNIFNQSCILLISVSVLFYNKNQSYLSLLPLSYLQFYSATGYINGAIIAFCLLIVLFLYSNLKNFILSIILLPLFFLQLLLFIANYLISSIYFYLMALYICGLLLFFSLKYHSISEIEFNWTKKLINTKSFQYSQFVLLILSAILIVVFFFFIYQYHNLYPKELTFVTLILLSCFAIFYLIMFKNKKVVSALPTILLLTSWSSIIAIISIIALKIENQSIWRIIYLNFGMGGGIDILLLFYIFILISINHFNLNVANKFYNWSESSLSLIILFLGFGFIAYNFYPIAVPLFNFSPSITTNFTKVSDFEKKLILTNFNTPSYKVFSDAQINYLLKDTINHSFLFFNNFLINGQSYHNVTNWTIAAYDIDGVIYSYDSKYQDINNAIVNRINELIKFNQINTFIFKKNSRYINDIMTNANFIDFSVSETTNLFFVTRNGVVNG